MRDVLITKFTGDAAEQHRLPAYEAVQSLYGVSRSLVMTTNYLAEGRVRRRDFASREFELNMIAQRPGSFETVFELITHPLTMTVVAGIGGGVAANFVTDFIKSIFNRAIGGAAEPIVEQLEAQEQLNPGDVGALVDAVEPAMRATHTAVGNGATNIIIVKGDNNLVNFNRATKEYVNTSRRDDTVRAKLFSIASYNANSRIGRAFDFELGKTIGFEVEPDADRETIRNILDSISSYAFKRLGDDLRSAIAIKYRSIVSIDDRVKKIIVIRARRELDDL